MTWMKTKAPSKTRPHSHWAQDCLLAREARSGILGKRLLGVKLAWPQPRRLFFFVRELRSKLLRVLTIALRPSRRTSKRRWGRWNRLRSSEQCQVHQSYGGWHHSRRGSHWISFCYLYLVNKLSKYRIIIVIIQYRLNRYGIIVRIYLIYSLYCI